MFWQFFQGAANRTLAIGTQAVAGTGDANANSIANAINNNCDQNFTAIESGSTVSPAWFYRSYGFCGHGSNPPVQIDVEGAGEVSSDLYTCMVDTLNVYSRSLPRFTCSDGSSATQSADADHSRAMFLILGVALLAMSAGYVGWRISRHYRAPAAVPENAAPIAPYNAMPDIENPGPAPRP